MENPGSFPAGESQGSRAEPDCRLREQLVSQYLGLVHHVARQVAASGSGVLDMDDLVGYGTIGLIEAIDRYDHERGTSFASYALHRIRGAMLDAARTVDPLPRSVRRKVKQIDHARSVLTHSLGREPLSGELCDATGIPAKEYREALTVLSRLAVPLESVLGQNDSKEAPSGPVLPSDPADEDFTERIEERELINALGSAIECLPLREKLVLSLYYKEDLGLVEIASVLNVSPSRVSQLKNRALDRLRVALRWHQAA